MPENHRERRRRHMFRHGTILWMVFGLAAMLAACASVPQAASSIDRAAIRFDGERSFALQETLATQFTDRHSGSEANLRAAEWVAEQMSAYGWQCELDRWTSDFLYGKTTPLNNTVCRLVGTSDLEIILVAHHDIAPTTIQGADNDASGVAIMLHLAEIFAEEGRPAHSMTFASVDAEEYGNLGVRRLVRSLSDPDKVVAAISLDNLGRQYYDRMMIEMIGQYRGYGPIWVARHARAASESAAAEWEVILKTALDQAIDQAAPVNFMDQGPFIAAGIPAIGFAGGYPFSSELLREVHYECWHDPTDSMDGGRIPECAQAAESLEGAGVVSEALVRHLLTLPARPAGEGPYLYFDSSQQILAGPFLALPFLALVGLFFSVGIFGSGSPTSARSLSYFSNWRPFFVNWSSLVFSLILLYVFTGLGWILFFSGYPATTKDPYLLNPPWTLIALWLAITVAFFWFARRVAKEISTGPPPQFADRRKVAMFVIGAAALYIFAINYFSLLFFLPVLFWLLIGGRHGIGWWLDLILFLAGGLVVYALYYQFGILTLRYGAAFTWYLINFFAIRMISVPTALAITAVVAAGLSLVIRPAAHIARDR